MFFDTDCAWISQRTLRPFELKDDATWSPVYATPFERCSCRNVNCMVIPFIGLRARVKDNIAVRGRLLRCCVDAEGRRVIFYCYIFMGGAAGSSRCQVADLTGPRLDLDWTSPYKSTTAFSRSVTRLETTVTGGRTWKARLQRGVYSPRELSFSIRYLVLTAVASRSYFGALVLEGGVPPVSCHFLTGTCVNGRCIEVIIQHIGFGGGFLLRVVIL